MMRNHVTVYDDSTVTEIQQQDSKGPIMDFNDYCHLALLDAVEYLMQCLHDHQQTGQLDILACLSVKSTRVDI